MKLKLLPALIASAFAGVAMTASAGTVQASYKVYASEVFGSDSVLLTAPTVNYSLATPLSGTAANPNTFSISWTLTTGGEWNAAPAAANIILADPVGGNQVPPTAVTLSADKKTITANFTLNNGFLYTVGSQIVLGQGGPVVMTKVGTKLGGPATSNGCGDDVAQVDLAVKLTNAAGVEFDSNAPGAINTTPLAQSKVAVSVKPKSSSAYGAAVANNEVSKVDVLQPSLGTKFTADADVTNNPANQLLMINIGRIDVTNKTATGLFDLAGSFSYSTKNDGSTQGADFGSNPNTQVGTIEAQSLKVDVSGNFLTTANGGVFSGSVNADCSTADVAGTIAADGKSATLTANGLQALLALAAGTKPLYLCYAVPGTKVIPTGQFKVTGGSLSKFANSTEINNPVCAGDIYNLTANGVKVDVRNYIPQVNTAQTGWYSVIRIINSDDQQTVSMTAQALKADGTLGASASLDGVPSTNGATGPFKPREVRYYINKDIDAALSANATVASPTFGAGDIGANARLRISAPSSSLRVQNYQYEPKYNQFLEASAAQSDEGPEADQKNSQNNR